MLSLSYSTGYISLKLIQVFCIINPQILIHQEFMVFLVIISFQLFASSHSKGADMGIRKKKKTTLWETQFDSWNQLELKSLEVSKSYSLGTLNHSHSWKCNTFVTSEICTLALACLYIHACHIPQHLTKCDDCWSRSLISAYYLFLFCSAKTYVHINKHST